MFKHAFGGGFINLIRSFWLSITAISVLTASLFLVALFAFATTSLGFFLRTFDSRVAIVVYYNEDVDRETIDVMIEDLRGLPEISELEFQDREAAQEAIQREAQDQEGTGALIDNLEANDLVVGLENLRITPESTEDFEEVLALVEAPKYEEIIESVEGTNNIVTRLQQYHTWLNIGGIVMIVICALVSILVMVNILRITIYQRKNEIEIMRLVGATNGYIRGPFIAEGLYYNVIASVVVAVGFVLAFTFGLPYISEFLGIQTNANTRLLVYQMYFSLGVTIISGIIVGMLTTYIATRRYLRL